MDAAAYSGKRKAFDLSTRNKLIAVAAQKARKKQIHPSAQTQGASIGSGTRVWQFCIILPEAQIGCDCNICAHVLIESDVVIGSRVTVKSGVQLWDGSRIEDDVFIAPNVTFTNDKHPRSHGDWTRLNTTVKRFASIGAGSTINPGVSIGRNALIGSGSVVTKDIPENAIAVGIPARVVGYRKQPSEKDERPAAKRSRMG